MTRKELTKAQVTKLAKMRRDGATWGELDEEVGLRLTSTQWREVFEEAGFDKLGRKGGKGKSSARAWGSADGNLRGRKPSKGRKAAPKKATGRKAAPKAKSNGKAKTSRKPAARKPRKQSVKAGDPF